MTHLVGGTVVIADEFKPESFLELVEKQRVTTTAMVPTMLQRLVSLGPEADREAPHALAPRDLLRRRGSSRGARDRRWISSATWSSTSTARPRPAS